MNWKPIFEDHQDKNRIKILIDVITKELNTQDFSDISNLLSGSAGICLYWEYLFLYGKNNLHNNNCVKTINSSLDSLTLNPMPYNFSSGVSGILWAYTYIVKTGRIKVKLDDIIDDNIHQFLVNSSTLDIQCFNYDYLYGGLGNLVYFLERSDDAYCLKCINDIIDELEKISEKHPEGISWIEGLHFILKEERRYNLGLAHGISSIIVLLSILFKKNIATEKIYKLMEAAVKWMLAQRQEYGENKIFPKIIPSTTPYIDRVGWCYGDLGIAMALLQSGLSTNNNLWKEEAIKLAKNEAKRRQPEAGVLDTCICHGTAGNAHLFNRLYNYTGIEEFKEASLYWYLETLEFYERNKHFNFFNGNQNQWEKKYGILEGIAGIGLTLLSTLTNAEPKWDRCLLLS